MKSKLFKSPHINTEIIIIFAILIGSLIRLNYLVRSDFPLNDGGLFYAMAKDLINNSFLVPQFTTYNQSQIPFAYPFLPIYFIAFLDQFIGINLLDSLHYLPFIFNITVIPFVYFLIKKLTYSDKISGLAILIYVLIRPSYEWFIFGGGITRSMSWLFAIIALNIYLDSIFHFKKIYYIFLPVLIALSFACHLEIGYFLVFTMFVFYIFYSRKWKGLVFIGTIGLLAILLLLPYWYPVIMYHGIEIFFRAFSAGEYRIDLPIAKIIYFNFTFEGLLPVFAVFSFLGFISCWFSRRIILPVWIIVILFLDPRSIDRSVAIAVSALAAIGYFEIVFPGLRRLVESNSIRRPISNITLLHSFFYSYIFIGALFQGLVAMPQMKGVSVGHREAMKQISQNYPESSRFLVLSTMENWPIDLVGEWFPSLAERHSVMTVQGSEWLAVGTYYNMIEDYNDLRICIKSNISCFQDWFKANQSSFDYVYFSKEFIDSQKIYVQDIFGNSPPVIENSDVLVFKVNK